MQLYLLFCAVVEVKNVQLFIKEKRKKCVRVVGVSQNRPKISICTLPSVVRSFLEEFIGVGAEKILGTALQL